MTAAPLPRIPARSPRFGGLFLRVARSTARLARPFAGKRWNPIFSIVRHTGRRSGRTFETPVAARRVADGFVVALAFGSSAHWYRNLVAAGHGVVLWRGADHPVDAPETIDAERAQAAFLPIQRAGLRLADIDGYILLPDAPAGAASAR